MLGDWRQGIRIVAVCVNFDRQALGHVAKREKNFFVRRQTSSRYSNMPEGFVDAALQETREDWQAWQKRRFDGMFGTDNEKAKGRPDVPSTDALLGGHSVIHGPDALLGR